MSDGITDAERKGRELSEKWKRREINSFLSMRTTNELVDALENRSEKENLDFRKQLRSQSHGKRVYRITVFVTEDEE